jgi:hypothetical protein
MGLFKHHLLHNIRGVRMRRLMVGLAVGQPFSHVGK